MTTKHYHGLNHHHYNNPPFLIYPVVTVISIMMIIIVVLNRLYDNSIKKRFQYNRMLFKNYHHKQRNRPFTVLWILLVTTILIQSPLLSFAKLFSFSSNNNDPVTESMNTKGSSSSSSTGKTTTTTTNTNDNTDTVTVTVNLPEYGKLIGKRDGNIDFFGSIPYVTPPVGPLRWAPPEPLTPWSPTILDATNYGPDCWQIIDPLLNPTADINYMSEDCLHLNIYTPAGLSSSLSTQTTNNNNKRKGNSQQEQQLLPVMVWLHGGAFQQGSARRPEYNGKKLAQRNTVVVTLNYRLGALGFLVSSVDGLYGNFGLMDQRAALYWIVSNIQYFGGDPNNITLFGESAGAVMTLLHLLMEHDHDSSNNNNDEYDNIEDVVVDKKSMKTKMKYDTGRNNDNLNPGMKKKKKKKKKRLFHKVIIQSNPLGLQFRSIVVADFIGEALKRSIDCVDLPCLRAERIEEIMRAQSNLMGIPRSVGDFFTWGPTLTQEFKLTIGAISSSSSSTTTSTTTTNTQQQQQQSSQNQVNQPSRFSLSKRMATTNIGSSSSTNINNRIGGYNSASSNRRSSSSLLTSREHIMFRDLDSWKWQIANRENVWTNVNVTQPLKYYELIPDDVPIIIGVNKHEGEMFVHSAFPITMSKAVYWMFVGALFRGSASRVLKHYRGYVDQIEKDAEELSKKQIQEEECKQFYYDNQIQLDNEYQYVIEYNRTISMQNSQNNNNDINIVNIGDGDGCTWSGYDLLRKTWGRGGAIIQNNQFDTISNQCPWYEKLIPFRRHRGSSSNHDDEWDIKMIEKRKLKEEKRILRMKERALKDAAKVVIDYRPVMSRIIDDYLFRCPAWNLAHKVSRRRYERSDRRSSSNNNNNNVFVYQFSHSTHIPGYDECWGKACHTSELPFVFEAMDIIRANYSMLGPYAQKEAPESPEYPYTDLLKAYRAAIEAADQAARYNNINNNLQNDIFYQSTTATNGGQSSTATVDESMSSSSTTASTTTSTTTNSAGTSTGSGSGINSNNNRPWQQHSQAFQRLVNHFFGDYFIEDADEEIASDMADRWVSFARTGDPNYVGSKADWRPWRKVFDDDDIGIDNDDIKNNNQFSRNDFSSSSFDNTQGMYEPEDFDEIFDLNGIFDTVLTPDAAMNLNNSNIEGNLWFDDPEDRMYRRRALIALSMEVIEEDVYKTLLRRSKYTEETDNPFHNFFHRLGTSTMTMNTNKNNKGNNKGNNNMKEKNKYIRRALRQLRQVAQEMGFIGTGIQGEPRRIPVGEDYYPLEEDFFPEFIELKWPPEGRLVERDCTCDMWDKIRYRY